MRGEEEAGRARAEGGKEGGSEGSDAAREGGREGGSEEGSQGSEGARGRKRDRKGGEREGSRRGFGWDDLRDIGHEGDCCRLGVSNHEGDELFLVPQDAESKAVRSQT